MGRTPHPAVALLPLITFALSVALSAAHLCFARRAQDAESDGKEERQGLLNGHRRDEERNGLDRREDGIRFGVQRWILKLLFVLDLLALYAISLLRMVATEDNKWSTVQDAGLMVLSIAMLIFSVIEVLSPKLAFASHTSMQTALLSLSAVVTTFVSNVLPYIYLTHPSPRETSEYLKITQFALSGTLGFLVLLIPPQTSSTIPSETASPLSQLVFTYLEPIMFKYYRHPSISFVSLVPALPLPLSSQGVHEEFDWKKKVERVDEDHRNRQAVMEAIKTYKWQLLSVLGYATLWIAGTFAAPLSMNLLLSYIQSDSPPSSLSPYVFAFGIFLSPVISSVSYQNAVLIVNKLGLRIRVVLGGEVMEKVLKIREGGGGKDKEEEGETSAGGGSENVGRVNNLVGTDIDVITSSLESSLQLLAIPPKFVISLVFLYFLLGWSAFVALATVIAFAPLSISVSTKYGGVQGEIMQATDKRITLVGELMGAIRVIKSFAWEKTSLQRIVDVRNVELGKIQKRAKVFGGMMLLSTGVPTAVTLTTFAAYVFGMKQKLTASTAFTSMALFGLLREAVISSTYLLSAFMRARVSLGRITNFLAATEEITPSSTPSENDSLVVSPSTFAFSKYTSSDGFKLEIEDEIEFPAGKLTIVKGAVGSGKSALLYALLGEMYREGQDGEGVKWPGATSVSYAAQEAWLQDTTIKENILFGAKYEEERYNQVLFQCALDSDLSGFPDGDETRVGEKGLSVSGGQKQRISLARAVYAQSDFVILDDVLSAVDSPTVAHLVEHCLNGELLSGRTVVLVTHFVNICLRGVDNCELVLTVKNGSVSNRSHPSHMMTRTPSDSGLQASSTDQRKKKEKERSHQKDDGGEVEMTEIAWCTYGKYFSCMGGPLFWILYAVVNISAHVFMLGQSFWIGRWVNASASQTSFYFSIYALIQLLGSISLTAMYLLLILGAIRASRILHSQLLDSIFGAPVRWFDKTPLGDITNRFSKDMEMVDTEIVESLQPVFDYAVQVLFVAISVTTILPIFLAPALAIATFFFFIGRLYIHNALAARRHVAKARAPLFSTLSDSTSGVVTIRAFRREEAFLKRYMECTDRYNKMQLHETSLNLWLEERSDLVGAIVSFIISLLALRAGLSAGMAGFLVSTGLEFTSRILYVVRAVNKGQLSFNAVERVGEYSTLEKEEDGDGEEDDVEDDWPQEGAIEFKNYSAKYTPTSDDVLKDLTFSIEAGEKVGIVGSSGCGKSSTALALLRIVIPSAGTITIDSHPISSIPLPILRSRITLIPQDPVLFSGTLRTNLDPEGTESDDLLWKAVKACNFVSEEDGNGKGKGLEREVVSGGGNLSQGQRQLLSLARAIVRRSKIIILDEATASLDDKSDQIVQRVVREEFADATNITIAHRLGSIMDFDRVLVMDAGRVIEFDTPRTLLDKKDSKFKSMVESGGEFDRMYKLTRAS